ncbi:unnamed protein product [Tuber melanosporum]|uniref:(Perigord truffle) hypothetical protein n=1 Tax=Tuber melanosporum (strain Mel28) TaxID=656061 RepID=D5GC42_TUBMM|nr:uncharacterized protein GSTUM_00000554001 [Tuber melanosporum]CAZ82085.1 unnamed protein product [Tuber melanosporum]
MPMKAEELKNKGNVCYAEGDYVGAEKFYTQAIIKDSTNAAFFTNRALVRLRMDMYDQVIDDCLKAIDLIPSSLKAYSYLGQAQLKLGYPNEALSSTLRAYELAIAQRSPSVGAIAATCLEVKKKRWELSEERRRTRECNLAMRNARLILFFVPLPGTLEKIQTLEEVFGKAEAERCGKREVPDYLIDNITFSVMLDPVITKYGHSYDRVTLLDHLKRSSTDPLTREPLTEKDLRPNLALKAACEAFLKENGWAVDW